MELHMNGTPYEWNSILMELHMNGTPYEWNSI
jgi:hypothetical protein